MTATTADGHPVLSTEGLMTGGDEVLDAEPDTPDETFYFPIDITTGFMIVRSEYRGAECRDGVLRLA